MIIQSFKNKIRSYKGFWRLLAGDPQISLEEMPNCPAIFHIYRSMLENGHKRVSGGWVYESQFYPDYLTVGGNTFAIRKTAQKYCKGIGLDIGASYWPIPNSTPIDTELGPGLENKIGDIPPNSQDYVYSSHCLEHIFNWQTTLIYWIEKIKLNGMLFLYLPHPTCKLWHISNPQMSNTHKWVPTPEIIKDFIHKNGMELIDFDDGPDHFFSFYVVAKKIHIPQSV